MSKEAVERDDVEKLLSEIEGLRAQLEEAKAQSKRIAESNCALMDECNEAKADTWDEAIQLLMDWMGKRGELATVKSEIRCLFEARSLRDRGGR